MKPSEKQRLINKLHSVASGLEHDASRVELDGEVHIKLDFAAAIVRDAMQYLSEEIHAVAEHDTASV